VSPSPTSLLPARSFTAVASSAPQMVGLRPPAPSSGPGASIPPQPSVAASQGAGVRLLTPMPASQPAGHSVGSAQGQVFPPSSSAGHLPVGMPPMYGAPFAPVQRPLQPLQVPSHQLGPPAYMPAAYPQ
jgi:hypothetical protein